MKEIKVGKFTFTSKPQSSKTKLHICMFGPHGSGKSTFMATCPGCAVIPLDDKTRYVVEKKSQELGVPVLMPPEDLVRETGKAMRSGWGSKLEMTDVEYKKYLTESKKIYRAHVDRVKEMTWAIYDHPDVKTVCIDLFGQFYQDVLYAHYGRIGHKILTMDGGKTYKDTKDADQEVIDFLNSLSEKHLVLTHKNKDWYENNVNTGKQGPDGFKYIGNHTNLLIESECNRFWNPNSTKEEFQWHWAMSIRKSMHNTDAEGENGHRVLKDEMISFPMLALQVFPDADLEDFI